MPSLELRIAGSMKKILIIYLLKKIITRLTIAHVAIINIYNYKSLIFI